MNTKFDITKVNVDWNNKAIFLLFRSLLFENELSRIQFITGSNIWRTSWGLLSRETNALMNLLCAKEGFSSKSSVFWNSFFELKTKERKVFLMYWGALSKYTLIKNLIENISGAGKGCIFDYRQSIVDDYAMCCLDFLELLKEEDQINIQSIGHGFEYDVSYIFSSAAVGKVFKKALETYFDYYSDNYDPLEFEDLIRENQLNKVFGLDTESFLKWLNGEVTLSDHIARLEFGSFLCYTQPVQLDFGDSKEIYFVGENGDGKTALLMAIFMAFNFGKVREKGQSNEVAALLEIVKKLDHSDRYKLKGTDNLGYSYTLDSASNFSNFYAYGTHRGRYSVDTDRKTYDRSGFMTLFDTDMTLHDPSDWLKNQRLKKKPQHEKMGADNLAKVIHDLLDRKVKVVFDEDKVYYEERGLRLTLKELSEGYRFTIIFICDLLTRLSENCPEGEDVFEQPGVVLIDEICQHLHPKWQLTIVRKLRHLFPNIQFFMTTHSPVIVQGSSEDAIFFRVNRHDGVNTVSEPLRHKDIQNWMLNTIVTSSLFDMDSAAMVGAKPEDVDTSDSALDSRIAKSVKRRVEEEKANGKYRLTDDEFERMMNDILN